MIPAPIAPAPTTVARRAFKVWWFGNWAGVVLVVLGVFGGIVWGAAASPLALRRWPLDSVHRIGLAHTDTWVLYEEAEGVAEERLPPAVLVEVREEFGTDVRVTMLHEPGVPVESPAYRDPWHEGRAIATFRVTRPGPYVVTVSPMPAGTYDSSRFAPVRSTATIAIGRRISTTWFNSGFALGPLVIAPISAGLAALITTRRRRRAWEAGSLPAHG